MFKTMHSVVLLASALSLGFVNVAAADLLTPTVAASSSSIADVVPSLERTADKTVDGSGLYAGASGVLGAADSTHYVESSTMWMTAGLYAADNNPSITYNLGSAYNVSTLRVWNYDEYLSQQLGAKDVEVYAGLDVNQLTLRGAIQLAEAPGDSSTVAQNFTALDLSNVQYVKLAIGSNWDGAVFDGTGAVVGADGRGLVGLSEVRFEGTSAVPEPSTLVLFGVAVASMLFYGWRKRR